ncbi:hypothetical protein [Novosphingobium sp. RL4]|uniref:hypothetical protein n=1 Tax=Novosphingobium sp. RL4 TaxID=3109595 RepID=UPI002D76A545|nr:hypothetical protein [Novosphingobium sp. RL4]WRT94059.1 hypothetical protein U9J33_05995 [Novosphingobium sp. RL4]
MERRYSGEDLGGFGRDVGVRIHAWMRASGFEELAARTKPSQAALTSFFGKSEQAGHPLSEPGIPWLDMTEVQAAKGLAHFLDGCNPNRMLAFLKALDTEVRWPETLYRVRAYADQPTGRGGRIDLLVCAQDVSGRRWGCVIELKFGHTGGSNPLAEYAEFARNGHGLGITSRSQNVALAVVGLRCDGGTTRNLQKNGDWRFVHWEGLLRRFERSLAENGDVAPAFVEFRKILWERVIR